MKEESTGRKIWNVIYPVIVLFVLYFAVIYGGMFVFSSAPCTAGTVDGYMEKYFSLIVVIALILITIVEYIFFKNDFVKQSPLLRKKPAYLAVIFVLGAACSHGLNLLISLFNFNNIFGSYEAVEKDFFSSGMIFVLLRAVILAPVAEELVFRGLVFRRLSGYVRFWPAAIISSLLFGLYHMNPGQGIYAFLFGILLSAVYYKFRNLWAPIVLHFAANLLSVVLTYTGTVYPSVALYIISMVLMFVVTSLIYWFFIRKISNENL